MFSKKATKYCQNDSEDFVNFCVLLRKRKLYKLALVNSALNENLKSSNCVVDFAGFTPAEATMVARSVPLPMLPPAS
jgi:hypothetical protein